MARLETILDLFLPNSCQVCHRLSFLSGDSRYLMSANATLGRQNSSVAVIVFTVARLRFVAECARVRPIRSEGQVLDESKGSMSPKWTRGQKEG
jgi:hypothetical protein